MPYDEIFLLQLQNAVEQASEKFALLWPSNLSLLFHFPLNHLNELRLNLPIPLRFYDAHMMVSYTKPAWVGRAASSG